MIEYKEVGQVDDSVLNVHEEYIENRYMWMLSRDFIKGEAAVKRKNETYLPMPTGFILKDEAALGEIQQTFNQSYHFDRKYDEIGSLIYDDPNYHPNKPYAMYKHGAKVPAILKHTINGLLGLIVKKPMQFIDSEDDVYDLGSEKEKVSDDTSDSSVDDIKGDSE